MASNIRRHSSAFDTRAGKALTDVVGYITGDIQDISTVRSVDTKSGTVNVADVTLRTTMADKVVESLFGKEFLNQYHSVTFRVTYWRAAAEHLGDGEPRVGQKAIALLTGMKPSSFPRRNGETGYEVQCTGIGFLSLAEEGEPGADLAVGRFNRGGGNNGSAAAAPKAAKAPDFTDLGDFDLASDDDCPF